MKYLLDTANIEAIKKGVEYLPFDGVTTNPSIVAKEGKIDFFEHMRQIRSIIGINRSLHIQVIATDAAGIVKDAETLFNHVDNQVYIKIPATMEGIKAMRLLKNQGRNVSATGIYTVTQGLLALEAGADVLIPYYNRMENLNIDPEDAIRTFAQMIRQYGYKATVVAASFKGIGQINKAFVAGAHAVTIDPALVENALAMPDIAKAVDDFSRDWKTVYGERMISDLF